MRLDHGSNVSPKAWEQHQYLLSKIINITHFVMDLSTANKVHWSSYCMALLISAGLFPLLQSASLTCN